HWRRIAAALALELPSLLLAIYGFRVSANGTTAVQSGGFAYDAKGEDLLGALQQIPLRLIAGWPSNTAYWIVIGIGLVWMALLLTARSDPEDAEARRNGWPYRLELIVLLAAAAYLFLPIHLFKP